jgi:hypothetical protein
MSSRDRVSDPMDGAMPRVGEGEGGDPYTNAEGLRGSGGVCALWANGKALEPEQLAALSAEQLNSLPAEFFAQLSPEQVGRALPRTPLYDAARA